jgi:diacylglycerol kinase (ATP)
VTEIQRIIAAFGHACDGLRFARNHPAFRIELLVSVAMIPLALWLGKNGVERAVLATSVLLVMVVELLNTGIEAAIDRISPEWHALSKRAKDMGSAAVLLSILNAALVWGLVLCAPMFDGKP